MADVINVEKGFSPWQPAHDAHLVKEYQYYEFPLAGVLEQHGVRYFFLCVTGADRVVNLWFYGHLSAADEASLDNAGIEDFKHAVDFEGPGVLALALEGPGVIATYLMDPIGDDEVKRGHAVLVAELERVLDAARELTPA